MSNVFTTCIIAIGWICSVAYKSGVLHLAMITCQACPGYNHANSCETSSSVATGGVKNHQNSDKNIKTVSALNLGKIWFGKAGNYLNRSILAVKALGNFKI